MHINFMYIEISGLCSNQWKPLEMKEVTNCSTYNYSKIKKLMIEVWYATIFMNIHIILSTYVYLYRFVKLIY